LLLLLNCLLLLLVNYSVLTHEALADVVLIAACALLARYGDGLLRLEAGDLDFGDQRGAEVGHFLHCITKIAEQVVLEQTGGALASLASFFLLLHLQVPSAHENLLLKVLRLEQHQFPLRILLFFIRRPPLHSDFPLLLNFPALHLLLQLVQLLPLLIRVVVL
jgi:hypothetical protein